MQKGHQFSRFRSLIFMLMLTLSNFCDAQLASSASTAQISIPSQTHAQFQAIEEGKLREQQRSTILTLATIIITSVLGFGTIAYNLRNTTKQAQLQVKLKAIDVVISAAGPNSARERLAVVEKIMGSDLALATQPKDLDIAGVGTGHDQNRKDLIQMLIENKGRESEVLALWNISFGKSALAGNIENLRGHFETEPPRGDA